MGLKNLTAIARMLLASLVLAATPFPSAFAGDGVFTVPQVPDPANQVTTLSADAQQKIVDAAGKVRTDLTAQITDVEAKYKSALVNSPEFVALDTKLKTLQGQLDKINQIIDPNGALKIDAITGLPPTLSQLYDVVSGTPVGALVTEVTQEAEDLITKQIGNLRTQLTDVVKNMQDELAQKVAGSPEYAALSKAIASIQGQIDEISKMVDVNGVLQIDPATGLKYGVDALTKALSGGSDNPLAQALSSVLNGQPLSTDKILELVKDASPEAYDLLQRAGLGQLIDLANIGGRYDTTTLIIETMKKCKIEDKEYIECPEVNCEDNSERIKHYVLDDRDDSIKNCPKKEYIKMGFVPNVHSDPASKPGGNYQPPASIMKPQVSPCKDIPATESSEGCNDNRWRDTCLTGYAQRDLDYTFAGAVGKNLNPVDFTEAPLYGVNGSPPFYGDPNESCKMNCVTPKNTQRISPLAMNDGWLFRSQCPGLKSLNRVSRDEFSDRVDMFYGVTKCFAILPKCQLNPKDTSAAFNPLSILNDFLNGLKMASATGAIPDYVKSLIANPKNRAPECKPAFWTRLMMDSCANQFIVPKGAEPKFLFTPHGQEPGISPRMCQPFKMIAISNTDTEKEEYNPHYYLMMTASGLLYHDYFPQMRMPSKPGIINQMLAVAGISIPGFNGSPVANIRGLGIDTYLKLFAVDGDMKTGPTRASLKPDFTNHDGKKAPSINEYSQFQVERIVDAYNPFTPRWHFDLDERRAWANSTATPLFPDPLDPDHRCAPPLGMESGYFQYGKCTVYCSAVPVDMLVFRRDKFDTCMGCNIKANSACFWSEVDLNIALKFAEKNLNDPSCGANTVAMFFGGGDLHKLAECVAAARIDAIEAVRYDKQPRLPGCWTISSNKAPCATRLGEKDDPAGTCTLAKVLGGACISPSTFTGPLTGGPSIAEAMDNAMQCFNDSGVDKICHELAKPIYSVNMLKIRPRLQSLKTDQPEEFKSEKWKNVESKYAKDLKDWQNTRNSKAREEDPTAGYDFEGYFHEHRPYMRNWDTAKESMQDGEKPNYWCDWGRNDAIVGVGRDANSMWGSQSKLCRYGGGNGQGDKNPLSCLSEAKLNGIPGLHNGWVDKYPGLAGSEWAELKMYQSRCYEK